jgi:hypothetical protein
MATNLENHCECDGDCLIKLKITKLNYSLVFFLIGGIVEMYTFTKTNDFCYSTGLGWGFFLAWINL